ncbi:winged helix-turn-helix domain-containing protein [Candidatus Omnitrophota bacterium]
MRLKVRSKVWLENNGVIVFGEGKSRLLKEIEKTGSINSAARSMGISYRRAWAYVAAIEKRLGIKLVDRVRGGTSGGGSRLTRPGRDLVRKFEKLNRPVRDFTDIEFRKVFAK